MTLSHVDICLNDIKLYGYHGITPEEQKVGSEFRINLSMNVTAESGDFDNDTMTKTTDYAAAYEVLRREFSKTSATLENVAIRILQALFQRFSILNNAEIEIHKLNPPLGADCASASVRIKMQR